MPKIECQPTPCVCPEYDQDMVVIQQATQRFGNTKLPLLELTADGRCTESNREHILGILEQLLPDLLDSCPNLATYFENHPQDFQDLIDAIAIHEHGEPDYDGNGNSDMPLSNNYTQEQHLSVKEQELAKFETWVLPLFAVNDQPRIHQLYMEFESCESSNWVILLANVLDRIHGDVTFLQRRATHLTPTQRAEPMNIQHAQNAIRKAEPNFLQLLNALDGLPAIRHELAVYIKQHLERFSRLGFDAHIPELVALKEKLTHL